MTNKGESFFKEKFEDLMREIVSENKIDNNKLSLVFRDLLDHKLGKANETSLGALLAALQVRGATDDEMITLFKVVQEYDRVPVSCGKSSEDLFGIVGSGKDEFKTFNISTCAAFVAASMGVLVIKNGSRSDTSAFGTTDLMESLGYNLKTSKNKHDASLRSSNIAFCDAESYFPRMAKEYVGKILFINPLIYLLSIASGIEFKNIIFGVSFDDTERVCNLLFKIGMKKALVVCGRTKDGLRFDEMSTAGTTKISELRDGKIKTFFVNPGDIGIKPIASKSIAQLESLEDAKRMFISILKGEAPCEQSDIVAFNAGAIYYLKNNNSGIDLKMAFNKAQQVIRTGAPFDNFKNFLQSIV